MSGVVSMGSRAWTPWRAWKRRKGWQWFETYDGGEWRPSPAIEAISDIVEGAETRPILERLTVGLEPAPNPASGGSPAPT
jgi:hypothetical protein